MASSRRDVGLSFDAFLLLQPLAHLISDLTTAINDISALLFFGLGVQSSSVLDKTRLLSNHVNGPGQSAQPYHLNHSNEESDFGVGDVMQKK